MNPSNLALWAKKKGIDLVGTGDFTHHLWLEELKSKLEDLGNGLFKYQGVYFILTAEISSIYSKAGRGHRVHNLIFSPSMKTTDKINATLARHGNLASDGRPILGLDCAELARIIFDIDENCMIVPGHAWTPWFSVFGSMSGFNRIEDCFEKQTPKIFALETGLSSDPAMNWRLSALDRYALISNSDSHSARRLGREANLFDCALANGLHPAKVVLHLPESAGERDIPLAARIAALKGLCEAPQVQMLDDFQPAVDELYLLGPTTPTRANLAAELERRFALRYHTLIHPTACVSPLAQLGQGVFVGANSVIGPGARLDDHVFVNRGVTIGHDTHIGSFSRIQPGANLGGLSRIGSSVTVAIGATLLERLVIGNGAFVGAGAVVTKDVPDGVLVLGISGKFRKMS